MGPISMTVNLIHWEHLTLQWQQMREGSHLLQCASWLLLWSRPSCINSAAHGEGSPGCLWWGPCIEGRLCLAGGQRPPALPFGVQSWEHLVPEELTHTTSRSSAPSLWGQAPREACEEKARLQLQVYSSSWNQIQESTFAMQQVITR